jgi:membrane-bound serine protease (ClpP class)
MSNVLILAFLGACAALPLVLTVMSRHKKSATGEIRLIGSKARVDSALVPEGTVLIHGELWRARSTDRSHIAPDATVRVVGLSGHLLLVER